MAQLPSTALQTGLLLSIQSLVVQTGHAALEAEFRHLIVDQQEVPQVSQLLLLWLLLLHHLYCFLSLVLFISALLFMISFY